jgi:Holliday junction resolvase RusA-like endonuclease
VISFEVVGSPAAQGSKKHVGNGVMVEMGKNHKPWRAAVASAARDAIDGRAPLDGPLVLSVEFRFPMPASRPKKVRELGRAPKVSAPDTDKLIRSVGDALKDGGLVTDDARFWLVTASKVEVTGWTGATIVVQEAA